MKKIVISLSVLSIFSMYCCVPAAASVGVLQTQNSGIVQINTSLYPSDILTDFTNPLNRNEEDSYIQPRWVKEVIVFVGGLAVGYIVDGVVVYYTGQPTSEWVAQGMKKAVNYYKANKNKGMSSIHVSRSGAIHGGGGGGF